MKKVMLMFVLGLFLTPLLYPQMLQVSDPYLQLEASQTDPIYTTYTATIERSRLYGDKGYKMVYYEGKDPISYAADQTGKYFTAWKVNRLVFDKTETFHKKPVIVASFPDMVIMEYELLPDLYVQETFFVYSSTVSMVNYHIENRSDEECEIVRYNMLDLGNEPLRVADYKKDENAYIAYHYETHKRLISNLYSHGDYPYYCRNYFSTTEKNYSYGAYDGDLASFYNIMKIDHYDDNKYNDTLNLKKDGYADFITLHGKFTLKPGESKNIRLFRGWQDQKEDVELLKKQVDELKTADLQKYVDDNVALYESVPRIDFKTEDEKLVYIGALNLARTCMLPPEGETSYNYYVFSREPLWGWGHGHQVLHESLSMLAYVYLDAKSAQESQRVYMEQQGEDGLIAYRHGPRGAQTYPHNGEPTTSAPFYSWINWEIYEVSKDQEFLEDAYVSGAKYVDWLIENRDDDKDGTFEWGPYGIIENVRDWYNAVFQVSAERYLDVDKEDISDELECLDLSLMVVKEMRSLSKMATALGKENEAKEWTEKADHITKLINDLMWDENSEFYYSVNAKDHSFFFMERDLKRMEIIGFLPLWAEAAPKDRVDALIKHLTDENKFWRTFGVPTLAADDSWYSPYVDYCCKWNGPVWLLWDYMIFDGLMNYGYDELAKELKDKLMLAVTAQLSVNHNFWESFSADNTVLNSPTNYIWDAIMAKFLIEAYTLD